MDILNLSYMKSPFTCVSIVAVENVVDLLSTAANYMDPTVWLPNLLIGTINYHYYRNKNVKIKVQSTICVLAVHPNSDKIIFYWIFYLIILLQLDRLCSVKNKMICDLERK
jgi:hypothetical protein